MEVLDMLKEKLNINSEEFTEVKSEAERINGILKRENINIDTQFQIGLYSHLVSFIRRMKKGENLDPIDEDIFSEIDGSSIDLAKEIAAPVFKKYKVKEDKSEVMLISIHIQTIKKMCGGGE